MLLGILPDKRHDGSRMGEAFRQRMAGQPLERKAILVEIKGDWELYADVLHLPRWNDKEGICFLCKATKEHLPFSGLNAEWRQSDMRLNHTELVQRLMATKESLSPMWQWPLFNQACIKIDWLHAADQGVAAALAGSILCLFVDPPGVTGFGPTIEDRRLTLWNMLLAFYKEQGFKSDKLKSLPCTRFRFKPPVLKAQAATIRKMIPWFVFLMKYPDVHNEEHKAVMVATMALGQCYKCLSHTCQRPAAYLIFEAAGCHFW